MNPNDDRFWMDELRRVFAILVFNLRDAIMGGIDGGFDQLETISTLSEDAIESFIREYAFTTANYITNTSRNYAVDTLLKWRQSGEPLTALVESLEPMFGEGRAEMIAITETTTAFAEGNRMAWRESGVVSGMQWVTVNDSDVCPLCEPLDGMIVDIDGEFTTEEGEGVTGPALHSRCRCYLQPVVEE